MDMRAWTPMSAYTSSTSCWRGLRCTPLPDGSKCAAITAFAAVAAAFFRCCCVRGRISCIGAALAWLRADEHTLGLTVVIPLAQCRRAGTTQADRLLLAVLAAAAVGVAAAHRPRTNGGTVTIRLPVRRRRRRVCTHQSKQRLIAVLADRLPGLERHARPPPLRGRRLLLRRGAGWACHVSPPAGERHAAAATTRLRCVPSTQLAHRTETCHRLSRCSRPARLRAGVPALFVNSLV